MSKAISRGLCLVLFTGGLTLLGTTVANAADTSGDDGVLSGTQVLAPIAAPVDVTGNAISILGDAVAAPAPAPAAPAAAPAPAPAPAPVTTSGVDSLLGGTQAVVEAAIPVTIGGNAVSLTGDAASIGTAAAPAPVAPVAAAPAAPTTSGTDSIGSGSQILPTVSVPVTVGGNAISLLGDAVSEGATSATPTTAPAAGAAATTSGGDSVLGGTQVLPNITVPVNLGGNAISLLGDSVSSGASTATGTTPGAATTAPTTAPSTSGDDGIAGGTQVVSDITVPVNLGGNAISVLGDSVSTGSATGDTGTTGTTEGTTTGASTSGDDAVLGGTQVAPAVTAPVTVGGNAISVLGDSASTGSATGGTGTTEGTGTGATTSGDDGIAGGTQVAPVVTAPVTVGGNAISILGDSVSEGAVTSNAPEGTSGDATTSGDDGILGGTQIVPALNLPILIEGNAVSITGDGVVSTEGFVDGFPEEPTEPVTPVIPVTPVTPVTPVAPVAPVVPTTPAGTDNGTTVASAGSTSRPAALTTSAITPSALASTGVEIAPLLGLVALLLIAGLALALAGRRTAAQQ